MGYQVRGELWGSVFAVPSAVVDEHLKRCSAGALKVLLAILRMGALGGAEEISRASGLAGDEVAAAIEYWVGVGVLVESKPARPADTIAPPDSTARAASERVAGRSPSRHRQRHKLTTREINEIGQKDQNISFVLREAQMILGGPLTPVSTEMLSALYSYYGMAPDVILMLLQYCITQGKNNMRYVEKVAMSWVDAGIDTHEAAEREIIKAKQRGEYESKVRKIVGVYDRALITGEREYIADWKDKDFSEQLVGLAYERTIEQKNKLSFAYMNGILQNWHSKGITTAEQAKDEMRKKPLEKSSASEEMDEMARIFKYGDV